MKIIYFFCIKVLKKFFFIKSILIDIKGSMIIYYVSRNVKNRENLLSNRMKKCFDNFKF